MRRSPPMCPAPRGRTSENRRGRQIPNQHTQSMNNICTRGQDLRGAIWKAGGLAGGSPPRRYFQCSYPGYLKAVWRDFLGCREMALELVCGADFSWKLMCRAGPGDLRGPGGRLRPKSPGKPGRFPARLPSGTQSRQALMRTFTGYLKAI